MLQAEVRIQLDAITHNVRTLKAGTAAAVMAVVKGDGYGHGMIPSARAALAGGATWLGACTLPEAMELRGAGITAPVLAWLLAPGAPLAEAIEADVDVAASSLESLAEIVAASRAAHRPARVHLKIDTGLTRSGSTPCDWPDLVETAAKAQADADVDVVGVWSHFAYADAPGHPTIDRQLAVFHDALDTAERTGISPQVRHIANSAATLTRPDTHFDLVRPGIAIYGLSPIAGRAAEFGLRPAMGVRGGVVLAKRVQAGSGVSYGHTYTTSEETTVAVVPLGYADGIPRAASNAGPVKLAGRVRRIAGRVCMDQIVLDCHDDVVKAGDIAVLIGSDEGDPSADDWAEACGTINYEIVTRMGSTRIPRVYVDASTEPSGPGTSDVAAGETANEATR